MKKTSDRQETAYCGLWCGGCVSGNHALYDAARSLEKLLNESGFSAYAAYKANAGKNPVKSFENFPLFMEILSDIQGIECRPTCYNGPCSGLVGCTPACRLRVCVLEKGLEGCWECGERSTCEDFLELDSRHPELQDNIRCLQSHGADDWARFRTPIDVWDELEKKRK